MKSGHMHAFANLLDFNNHYVLVRNQHGLELFVS